MSDLVEKFYRGELSEAEEEALDQLLESSPEDADRFARVAADAYNRYGLPGAQKGFFRSWGLKAWVLPIFLAVILTAGYKYWRGRPTNSLGFSLKDSSVPAALPMVKNNGLTLPASTAPTGSVSPDHPNENGSLIKSKGSPTLSFDFTQSKTDEKNSPGGQAGPRGAQNSEMTAPPAGLPSASSKAIQGSSPPASTPVFSRVPTPAASTAGNSPALSGAELKAKNAYGLKVTVEISQAGPVTVRVLDTAGSEMRILYYGSLAPGKYSYIWDGRSTNGLPAIPGKYRIETRSGSSVQLQEFQFGNQTP